jgi:hypothetical protein
MSILGPILGRPWLRRRNARLLRDAGRAINEAGYPELAAFDARAVASEFRIPFFSSRARRTT